MISKSANLVMCQPFTYCVCIYSELTDEYIGLILEFDESGRGSMHDQLKSVLAYGRAPLQRGEAVRARLSTVSAKCSSLRGTYDALIISDPLIRLFRDSTTSA